MYTKWDMNAKLRRHQIELGLDITFTKVFIPWYIQFLKRNRPKNILEIGAGTGHLALELSKFVDEYLAIEPSKGMMKEANDVLSHANVSLKEIEIADLALNRYYDMALSHMCIQSTSDCKSFICSMASYVAPGGCILLSLPHPCFYNDYKKLIPADEYQYMSQYSCEVSFYISLDPENPIQKIPYCHRPLSFYIRAVRESGFMVEEIEEVYPCSEVQELYPEKWATPRYIILVGRR